MTKKEKEEVIKKMNLGNKYVNRAIYILNDFVNFMIMVCIVIVLLVLIKMGFIGTLLFLRDCIIIYIVATLISSILSMIFRKLRKRRR